MGGLVSSRAKRSRHDGWRATVRLAAGGIVGAAASAAVLAVISSALVWASSTLPEQVRVGSLAAVGTLAVARDLGWVRFRLPENRRQIPREVFGSGVVAGTARFGFELGTGVRTYMSASAPYLLAVLIVMLGNAAWVIAFPIAMGFGIGRAVGPAIHAFGWSSDWRGLMQRIGPNVAALCTAATAISVLLAYAALTGGR